MDGDPRDAGFLGQLMEPVEDVVRCERSPVGSAEHETCEQAVRISCAAGRCSCAVPEGGGDAREMATQPRLDRVFGAVDS
ncbi:hypothetical protein GCM10010394_30930 [Streptomyces crystallinus]|uniref:Uncharacterized protein n=1 Tax=Streptomyces crystallinus TaxID=68191 RepID=A0ABP3QX23_9ACTN